MDDTSLKRIETIVKSSLSTILRDHQIKAFSSAFADQGFFVTKTVGAAKKALTAPLYRGHDFIRYATLATLAAEINHAEIQGSIAELGVYKGAFAKYMRKLFPGRTLYLFDTFEGFDKSQINTHRKSFNTNPHDFSDTSVETVLKNIGDPNPYIVKKGIFPSTAKGLTETFAFVSLDGDLYESIRDGLDFFYPLLANRGYIMIHDCPLTGSTYPGSRRAVLEFCQKVNVPYIPLPDSGGTIIVSK